MKEMLSQFLRRAAMDGYVGQFHAPDAVVEEIGEDPGVLGHWMSLALVAAPSIRITFKAHFQTSSFGGRFVSDDSAESTRLSRDAMNEYANVVTGILKSGLRSSGVDAGMSLPLSIRGFNEIYFQGEDSEQVLVDRWTIRSEDFSVNCSAVVELLDPEALQAAGVFSVQGSGDLEWLEG